MLFPLLVGVAAGVAIQRYILADEENRIHEIFDGFDRYYNKGMLMGVQELIYKMSQTEKVIELMGYTKALKEKFEKLDEEGAPDWQLKQLFKMAFAFATHTELGKEAMFPVMEKRGLAHREKGKIVCDY